MQGAAGLVERPSPAPGLPTPAPLEATGAAIDVHMNIMSQAFLDAFTGGGVPTGDAEGLDPLLLEVPQVIREQRGVARELFFERLAGLLDPFRLGGRIVPRLQPLVGVEEHPGLAPSELSAPKRIRVT